MLTIEKILSIPKSDLAEAAKALKPEDIALLVEWLSRKEDNIRYQAFLLLQNRSIVSGDVYAFWDVLRDKLHSGNSYQRSIGLMLIAENARWDTQNRMQDTLNACLALLKDEKPVTIRQCIQSLGKIALAKPELQEKILSALLRFDVMGVKESMRKSILMDILKVLLPLRKEDKAGEIQTFILNALSGEVLDKKAKKQIEALL